MQNSEMKHYRIYLDGGSNNADSTSRAYGSFLFINQQTQNQAIKRIEHGIGLTSNDAEWLTLISVLKTLRNAENAKVELFMDSKLIVNQFRGKWRCKNARMIEHRIDAWNIRNELDDKGIELTLEWVPREDIEMMVGH